MLLTRLSNWAAVSLLLISFGCVHDEDLKLSWHLDDDVQLNETQENRKFRKDGAQCRNISTYSEVSGISGVVSTSRVVDDRQFEDCMISKGWILTDEKGNEV